MGWADMLSKLNIPYDSEKAISLAEDIADRITEKAFEWEKKTKLGNIEELRSILWYSENEIQKDSIYL